MASRHGTRRITPYAPARARAQGIFFHRRVLEAPPGDRMAYQARKGLPEPGDFRPGSWRDVVGLLMALVGLALIVGMALSM
jgi:hypothetical protein